jgi:transposase
MTVPGLGPVTASAMAAGIQDVSVFSGPREFAGERTRTVNRIKATLARLGDDQQSRFHQEGSPLDAQFAK